MQTKTSLTRFWCVHRTYVVKGCSLACLMSAQTAAHSFPNSTFEVGVSRERVGAILESQHVLRDHGGAHCFMYVLSCTTFTTPLGYNRTSGSPPCVAARILQCPVHGIPEFTAHSISLYVYENLAYGLTFGLHTHPHHLQSCLYNDQGHEAPAK